MYEQKFPLDIKFAGIRSFVRIVPKLLPSTVTVLDDEKVSKLLTFSEKPGGISKTGKSE